MFNDFVINILMNFYNLPREREHDLERRFELLNRELRAMLAIEGKREWIWEGGRGEKHRGCVCEREKVFLLPHHLCLHLFNNTSLLHPELMLLY